MDTGPVDSTDLVDPAAVHAVPQEPPADGVLGRMEEGQLPAVEEVVPPALRSIKLLELPTEVLLLILESLLAVGPITLLGSVPGVCRRLRAVCARVHGEFDLRGEWARLDERDEFGQGEWAGLKGALASAGRLFPRTKGLWTFSKRPLHDACEAGLVVVAARLLVVVAADMDNAMDYEDTALHVACLDGHLDVARLLAEKGADVDKAMNDGVTPLHIACEFGHADIARLLVENGADLSKADDEGRTAVAIAWRWGHTEIVALLEEAGAAE